MLTTSSNGWRVFLTEDEADEHLRSWEIPNSNRAFRLRKGPAGLVLAHLASWFHHRVEILDLVADDWGWSPRANTGNPDEWSNHASATAVDFNAARHPYGKADTFQPEQVRQIRRRLDYMDGCIRWGGDYRFTQDEMHFEIVVDQDQIITLGAKLRDTKRGQALLNLNRGHF